MKESTSREKVLKNIREALVNNMPPPFENVDLDSDVFVRPGEEFPEVVFADAFSRANGQFIYCSDFDELNLNLKALISKKNLSSLFCAEDFIINLLNEWAIGGVNNQKHIQDYQAAITSCEVLVSRTGSIVVSSHQNGGRKAFSLPPVHIVIASTRQLVYNIKDALHYLNVKYSGKLPGLVTFLTGPSRTADIEKTLVHGAHGPRELFLFLVENR